MRTALLASLIVFTSCTTAPNLEDDVTVSLDNKADGTTKKGDVIKTYAAARVKAATTLTNPVAFSLDGARQTPASKMQWSWRFIDGHRFADVGVTTTAPDTAKKK